MIQGILKAFKLQGVSEQSGIPYCEVVIEQKGGELVSAVAFRDDALELSGYQVGDEIKACGQKKRGEEQYIISYSEKVTRFYGGTEANDTPEAYENRRRDLISRLGREQDTLREIESLMEEYGALEIAKELKEIGIHWGKREGLEKYREWKERKFKEMKERVF